jgi:hypothetical protein
MKSRIAIVVCGVVAALVALVLAPLGATSALETGGTEVYAVQGSTQLPTETRVLAAGEVVQLTAAGTITTGCSTPDRPNCGTIAPDGERDANGQLSYASSVTDADLQPYTNDTVNPSGVYNPYVSTQGVTGCPIFALLYRLGGTGAWSCVGTGPTTVTGNGEMLQLWVFDDRYGDNGGAWSVTVTPAAGDVDVDDSNGNLWVDSNNGHIHHFGITLDCDGSFTGSSNDGDGHDLDFAETVSGQWDQDTGLLTFHGVYSSPAYPGYEFDGVATVVDGTYSNATLTDTYGGVYTPETGWDWHGIIDGGPDDCEPVVVPQATIDPGVDQTVPATGPSGGLVTYVAPTSSTPGATVSCTPASGTTFAAVGSSTLITCAASAPGTTGSAPTTFTVTIGCSPAVGFGGSLTAPLPKASVKLGSTLPVKVRSTTCWTVAPSTIFVKIYDAAGTAVVQAVPTSSSKADTPGQLRGGDGQYIFNLDTGKLTVGKTYTVKLSGGAAASSTFSVTK